MRSIAFVSSRDFEFPLEDEISPFTRRYYLHDFGARCDGTSVHEELREALEFINSVGGGTLVIDCMYFLSEGVQILDWDCDCIIEGEGSAGFYCDNTFDIIPAEKRTFIQLYTSEFASKVFKCRLTVRDLLFDLRLAPNFVLVEGLLQGAQAVSANFFNSVTYERIVALGAPDDWYPTSTTRHGDSGLLGLARYWVAIDCFLQGWADCGLYTNGTDAHNADAGYACFAIGCYFRRCGVGYSPKREWQFAAAYSCTFEENLYGVSSGAAGVDIRPADRVHVKNCAFFRTSRSAIVAQYSTKLVAESNYIEDFGCDFDGVTLSTGDSLAISFKGSSDFVIRDCTVWQKTWTPQADQSALYVRVSDFAGTTYFGGNGTVDGLHLRNCWYGVTERDVPAEGAVQPSYMTNIVFEDMTVGGQLFVDNADNTPISTVYYDTVGDTAGPYKQIGTALFQTSPSYLTASTTYDPPNLVDGTGVTTTVVVTGALNGYFAQANFTHDLQGIMLTAWVSAADTVSVRFQNETGGAIDLASGTLNVRATR